MIRPGEERSGPASLENISESRRRKWSLTGQAFDALLARLSPDREEAARQFEVHRRYLITLLTYAGAADPEHLADMTMDRAAKRLMDGEAIENLGAWLRGAARLIYLESQTEQRRETAAATAAVQSAGDSSAGLRDAAETDHQHLEECLALLPAESRRLIDGYYRPKGELLSAARRRLSLELGISAVNLRARALRVRKTLEDCLRKRREKAAK
jgi:DNA-directed RNA polymerase specialized sigma24 family protein